MDSDESDALLDDAVTDEWTLKNVRDAAARRSQTEMLALSVKPLSFATVELIASLGTLHEAAP